MWPRLMYQGRSSNGIRAICACSTLQHPPRRWATASGRIGCLTSGDGDYGLNDHTAVGCPHQGRSRSIRRSRIRPACWCSPHLIYELLFSPSLLCAGTCGCADEAQPRQWANLLGEYLVLSGIGRFLVEFIRRNEKIYFGMSNAQIASLATVIAGLLLVVLAKRNTAYSERITA